MFHINHYKTRVLFLLNAAILLIVVSGYFLWSPPSSAANTTNQQDVNISSEKQYYKDLVYAVNEINNEIQSFEEQYTKQQDIPAALVQEEKDKVDKLFQPLSDPPERFQVSFMIADDLHKYYSNYVSEIDHANPNFRSSSRRTELTGHIRDEYQHFRENYQLIQVFDQFKSIDIDCH